MMMTLRSVRGATSVASDTAEAIESSVATLLQSMADENAITPDAICAVFFTLTDDLHALAPAKVARTVLPWQQVALFMAQEPTIVGLPPRMVRVLIQFETERAADALVHVYHGDAKLLRPDR